MYRKVLILRYPQRRWQSTAAVVDTNVHSKNRLLEPIQIGNVTLANRVLMGSMHTGLEGHSIPRWLSGALNLKTHSHLDQMASYFKARAEGYVGLMVTGGVAPNREGWTSIFGSKLNSVEEMEAHKVVTQAVHDVDVPIYGSDDVVKPRICLQILHTGRYGYHPLAVSATRTKSPISPFTARGLSLRGVEGTIQDFVGTAALAQQAGYDGVEVMGSEGYLISQFLSPAINTRKDQYGGTSLENRARLPLEIVKQTRAAVGDDFLIIFRISLLDLVHKHGLTTEESHQLALWLQEAGVSVLNTGIGWHESRIPTIATCVPRAAFSEVTHDLRQVVDVPVVATNRINAPHVADELLRDSADLVSLARPLLADADFVRKVYEDRSDEINTCIACNQACLDHAFVGKTASCLVNPLVGEEETLKLDPVRPSERLEIGVVGAGPAGLAASLAAAQRGHSVTLYDSDSHIGGQFQMARRIPGKEEFHETLRYFSTMLRKHNVQVMLNTTVNIEDFREKDKWVLATGVMPRDPLIPGQDHPSVLSYLDVLKYDKQVGRKVAVIGAGGIGFDVAEFLLHHNTDRFPDDNTRGAFFQQWGIDLQNRGGLTDARPHVENDREILLLQRKKGKMGKNLGKTTGWIHRATLQHSERVQFLDSCQYERIDENGNLHIDRNGIREVLEVDNIVVCAGQVKHHPLLDQAHELQLDHKVFTIGGAYEAGELDAKRAINMGVRLAHQIHTDVKPGQHVFTPEPTAEEQLHLMAKRWGLL